MAAARRKIYTRSEYLAREVRARDRHEFLKGEMIMMEGATIDHSQIKSNLILRLHDVVRAKGCELFATSLRLGVNEGEYYVYPDVMVICGEIELERGREDVVTNPKMVIEIWSEATKHYDSTTKFSIYARIPSLQEYVMIDQRRVHVECFRRAPNNQWENELFENKRDTLRLQSIGEKISLVKIYERVWEDR